MFKVSLIILSMASVLSFSWFLFTYVVESFIIINNVDSLPMLFMLLGFNAILIAIIKLFWNMLKLFTNYKIKLL